MTIDDYMEANGLSIKMCKAIIDNYLLPTGRWYIGRDIITPYILKYVEDEPTREMVKGILVNYLCFETWKDTGDMLEYCITEDLHLEDTLKVMYHYKLLLGAESNTKILSYIVKGILND